MTKVLEMLRHLFRRRTREPEQIPLPFFCGYYGLSCRFVQGPNTGFYTGVCRDCGIAYDPINDR